MYELDEMDKIILVFKPKGKRLLGICRCRWKNVVKMRLINIMYKDVWYIQLAHGRLHCQVLVNTVMIY
jgi:hypothetical protein